MKIGIDFDNTIACYEGVFHKAALERRLIPPEVHPSKRAVRDYLRSTGQESAWTELQGYIYGARMDLSHPYPGFARFLSICQSRGADTCIISHKTLHPFIGPKYDLHQAALSWLYAQSFPYLPPPFFELTLEEKLRRIEQEKCTLFIDDLPEVLAEKAFPQSVKKILFDPHRLYPCEKEPLYASSWDEIATLIFDDA